MQRGPGPPRACRYGHHNATGGRLIAVTGGADGHTLAGRWSDRDTGTHGDGHAIRAHREADGNSRTHYNAGPYRNAGHDAHGHGGGNAPDAHRGPFSVTRGGHTHAYRDHISVTYCHCGPDTDGNAIAIAHAHGDALTHTYVHGDAPAHTYAHTHAGDDGHGAA